MMKPPSSPTPPNPPTTPRTLRVAILAQHVALIRPADGRAHEALDKLARQMGAHIQRGVILLAERPHAALLAIASTGEIVAALLLDEAPEPPEPPGTA